MAERLTTADGRPLKRALLRAETSRRRNAFLLTLPLLLFILVWFVFPILGMLRLAVVNEVRPFVPGMAVALRGWDAQSIPDEAVFAALRNDMITAERGKIGRFASIINASYPGASSLFNRTARGAADMEPPYRDAFLAADARWGDLEVWKIVQVNARAVTLERFVKSLSSPYPQLFWRTLWMSAFITLLCFLLAYPLSYFLAMQPPGRANLFMILVLLPFWTSLLVRTSAWIAWLQGNGIINDILDFLGFERQALIRNKTGTIVAMTHILLPFMILPLYSIMRVISPSLTRAARSLGANALVAHARIYFPLTLPGIAAGVLLVFVLAVGYYITPTLVGGSEGVFISSIIADQISVFNNKGLASAMGVILLAVVLVFYFLFNWLVGVDKLKLG